MSTKNRVQALSKRTISRDDSLEYFIKFPSANVLSEPINEPSTSAAVAPTLFDAESKIVYTEANVPVVLLLGWAGCQDRYLMKYSKIYENRGLITLRYTAPLENMFWNRDAMRPLGLKVMKLLLEMNFDAHPLFVHVFSNGGAYLYQQILRAIKQTNSQINFCGVIFDSAPGERHLISLYRATSAIYGSCFMACLITITIIAAWTFETILKRIVFFVQSIPYENDNPYKSLMSDDCPCPELFLYSRRDKLIPYRDVERFSLHRKNMGVPTESVCFDDAEHVKLYMNDPEKYVKSICCFMNRCLAGDNVVHLSKNKNV